MNQNLTKLEVALVSGIKAFGLSGITSVSVLLSTGLPNTPRLIAIAIVIAFITGGLKGLEKAYNYQP